MRGIHVMLCLFLKRMLTYYNRLLMQSINMMILKTSSAMKLNLWNRKKKKILVCVKMLL